MVNNFFEYCLISYLVKEDINLLKELRRGNPITTSNVVIKTHEFFERDDRILIEGEDYFNLPDIFMASGDEKIIIQVYDGVPNKDIMDRFESFELDQFNNSKIYVFASCISSLEMLKQKKNTFKLFHVNQKEQSIKEVLSITFGKLVIDINSLNDQYFQAYNNFSNCFYYWSTMNQTICCGK